MQARASRFGRSWLSRGARRRRSRRRARTTSGSAGGSAARTRRSARWPPRLPQRSPSRSSDLKCCNRRPTRATTPTAKEPSAPRWKATPRRSVERCGASMPSRKSCGAGAWGKARSVWRTLQSVLAPSLLPPAHVHGQECANSQRPRPGATCAACFSASCASRILLMPH